MPKKGSGRGKDAKGVTSSESVPHVRGVGKRDVPTNVVNFSQRLELLADRFDRKKLVEYLGVGESSYDNYLKGRREPPASALARCAVLTGCDPRWLLTGEGEPFPGASPETPAGRDQVNAALQHLLELLRALASATDALLPLLNPNQAAELRRTAAAIARELGGGPPPAAP